MGRDTRLLIAVGILLPAFVMLVAAASGGSRTQVDRCPNQPEVLKTASGAHKRAQKGWNSEKVKKDKETIQRVRTQARCAPTKEGRKYVNEQIDKAKKQYKKAKIEKFYRKLTAVPGQAWLRAIRQCESTNRYNDPSAPAGAYGMLQGWDLALTYWTKKMTRYFGYPSSPPYTATRKQQDILASLLYQHYGPSPWECKA